LGAIKMFQTEPIIYLQSLGTQWFTFLMILITTMGSSSFLVALIVIITFGFDFKKGVLLFQLLLWTGLVIETLKILVAFPRPDFVDNRVFIGHRLRSYFRLPLLFFESDPIISYSNHSSLNLFLFTCCLLYTSPSP